MGVDLSTLPMLARRAIEAELALHLYEGAKPTVGADELLLLLGLGIDRAARLAGQAFAAKAPGGAPSLAHFATVVELWRGGGALNIADLVTGADCLSFAVTRCGYMEKYREMGLPHELHAILSCRRDAAFAEGYSPHLRMERPQTISQGAPSCLFRFRWMS